MDILCDHKDILIASQQACTIAQFGVNFQVNVNSLRRNHMNE